MAKVIVTGGAGFIGSNIASHCLRKGFHVVIYDNLARKGCLENLRWLEELDRERKLEVLIGDIRLPASALCEHIESADVVYHMAAQVAVTTSVVEPRHDLEVNAVGTFNLLDLIRRSKGKKPTFVYASTNKVYGGMEDVRVEEGPERYRYLDYPEGIPEARGLDFHSPYGCSKGAGDQYARDFHRIYGLKTVAFRQSCIYGPRQFGLEDQGWIAWFIIATELGRPLTIYGNGKQVRDVLYIDDLLEAYDMALERPACLEGGIYNIGGGPKNAISLLDLLALLREERKHDLDVSYSDWRPGDQPVYISDIRKAAAEFDWRPATEWRTGVLRLIRWVRDHRSLLERVF
jgi:CDP-paratose 2-epimerase